MTRAATGLWLAVVFTFVLGCGAGRKAPTTTPADLPDEDAAAELEKQPPPEPGEPRDVQFPPITHVELDNGLAIDTVAWRKLPVAYLHLVIESGGEADPDDMPGLSRLIASMLKEGTRSRTSAELAEQVEFLGANLWTSADSESIHIGVHVLRDQLDEALDILADVAMNPAFRNDELRKLKRRELDRLALESKQPSWLAQRELHRVLYGDHPYAHVDTTTDVVERVSRADMVRWHRDHFAPNNAFLVVVGDVNADDVQGAASKAFAKWRQRKVPEPAYPAPPERDQRQVILVDRPASVQSMIYIGNLAIPRSHGDWVPLEVANQVLGGSAASRLFMDLRERRSLTYGAYSRVGARVQVGPFRASAAVANPKTAAAMDAFFEHLDRIVGEEPSEAELANAKRYLVDSFPLQIDTPGKIASLVADLRLYGLPEGYWDTYRSKIQKVDAKAALTAAKAHIRPDDAIVVVVGRASDVLEPLRRLGEVTVLDTQGKEIGRFEQVEAGAEPKPEPKVTPEDDAAQ
jgi:zinc protease